MLLQAGHVKPSLSLCRQCQVEEFGVPLSPFSLPLGHTGPGDVVPFPESLLPRHLGLERGAVVAVALAHAPFPVPVPRSRAEA